MSAQVYDDRVCKLGEGPLWHPERQQLFWFDIMGRRMLSRAGTESQVWQFDEHVSAAGWIDHDTLLIASETKLFQFNIETETQTDIVALEENNSVTRSNDGRADPWGGFWIGTMGKNADPRAGAIYRYYRGELRKLYSAITIPNAICFSPDGLYAYFCDTPTRVVMRQNLSESDGWPKGEPFEWLDLSIEKLNPDGAVVDQDGCLWNAQWGANRIARYAPDGRFMGDVAFDARHTSCPAFGGANLDTLFCTSAQQGLKKAVLDCEPLNGATFLAEVPARGQLEHRVTL